LIFYNSAITGVGNRVARGSSVA